MNSTSRASRLVSSAARSPALAITGPEVARKFTPSSRARIWAGVVLPSPGGPTNNTWSSASRRVRAASMKTPRLARAWRWPMNSSSRCGRSEVSAASSSCRSAVTRRRGLVLMIGAFPAQRSRITLAALAFPGWPRFAQSLGELLKAEADQLRHVGFLADAACRSRNRGGRLRLAVTEIDQRRDRIGDRPRRALVLDRAGEPDHRGIDVHVGRRLVLELGDDALGDLGADAGGTRDHRLVAHGDRGGELGGPQRAEHRQRDLGADALHGLQETEPFALKVGEEAEQPDLILAHMGLDREGGRLSGARQFLQRPR